VFSHWVLDLIVHRPDLPIYDNVWKVGLGLWNYPAIAFVLEGGLMFGGMLIYYRGSRSLATGGRYGMIIFGIVMLLIQLGVFFGPPPPSPNALAGMALVSYFAYAWIAYILEKKRR